jgi:hypothetical protein
MHFLFIFTLLTFTDFHSVAQKGTEMRAGKLTENIPFSRSLEFHIVPLPIFDYTPRYRIGLEYETKKYGYALDFGWGNSFLNQSQLSGRVWKHNYHFYEIRPEFKYFIRQKGNSNIYTSLEIFSIFMSARFYDAFYYIDHPWLAIRFDEADFYKNKTGAHLKFGFKFKLPYAIVAEQFIGIGVARRYFDYDNVINKRWDEKRNIEDHLLWGNAFRTKGADYMLHLTLGVKFGINFLGFKQ